jgi:ribosomal protein S27AE
MAEETIVLEYRCCPYCGACILANLLACPECGIITCRGG